MSENPIAKPNDIREHYQRKGIKDTIRRCSHDDFTDIWRAGNGDFINWYASDERGDRLFDLADTSDYDFLTTKYRTLYWTLNYFAPSVRKERSNLVDGKRIQIGTRRTTRGYSLGIDIDSLKVDDNKQIGRADVRAALEAAVKFVCNDLKSVFPNGIYAAFSGNGAYVIIHHRSIIDQLKTAKMSDEEWDSCWYILQNQFNSYIGELQKGFFNIYPQGRDLLKFDALNNAKRVFKTIFSVHKSLPFAVIPLDTKEPHIDLQKAKLPLSDSVIREGDAWYREWDHDGMESFKAKLEPFAAAALGTIEPEPETQLKLVISPTPILLDAAPPCVMKIINQDEMTIGGHRAIALLSAYFGQVGWEIEDAWREVSAVSSKFRVGDGEHIFDSWFKKLSCPSCATIQEKGGGYPRLTCGDLNICLKDESCRRKGSPFWYAMKQSGLDKPELNLEDSVHMTDLGNGIRFAAMHKDKVRYCYPWGKWLIWDGTRWAIDNTGKISRFAIQTIRSIYKEAGDAAGEKNRKELAEHAIRSESDGKIKAMINQAQAQPDIQFLPEDLDKDPWLLNCLNGTIDLHTGKLLPHDPNNLITKICPVNYDTDAKATLWESCLQTWTDNNKDLIDFLQRGIGYSLTGHNGEECVFLPWGSGRNGKSRFLGAIEFCMGDYARPANPETFMVKKNDTVSNDLASLQGVRFVPTIETEEGRRIAEALMKWITGNDILKVRFLYQEFFEYHPQFKLWLASNHKPEIRGTDNAIWERIYLIPFEVYIPEENRDKNLENKLQSEASGILTWAIRGCLEWQRIGLQPPEKIVLATKNYRREMDKTASWIEDCCILEPHSRSKNKELYESYSDWCLKEGEKPLYIGTFGKRLEEKGIVAFRTNAEKGRVGIRLKTASELEYFGDGCKPSLEQSSGTVTFEPDITKMGSGDGCVGSKLILRAGEGQLAKLTESDGSNRHQTSQEERMRALPRALEDGPKSHVELRFRLREMGIETTPEEFAETVKRAEVDNIILFRDEKLELMR